jgi:hypothetical protein
VSHQEARHTWTTQSERQVPSKTPRIDRRYAAVSLPKVILSQFSRQDIQVYGKGEIFEAEVQRMFKEAKIPVAGFMLRAKLIRWTMEVLAEMLDCPDVSADGWLYVVAAM